MSAQESQSNSLTKGVFWAHRSTSNYLPISVFFYTFFLLHYVGTDTFSSDGLKLVVQLIRGAQLLIRDAQLF
jgi:hypothetical protein